MGHPLKWNKKNNIEENLNSKLAITLLLCDMKPLNMGYSTFIYVPFFAIEMGQVSLFTMPPSSSKPNKWCVTVCHWKRRQTHILSTIRPENECLGRRQRAARGHIHTFEKHAKKISSGKWVSEDQMEWFNSTRTLVECSSK